MRTGRYEGHQTLCSDECARLNAVEHRMAFARKRPERAEIYRQNQREKQRKEKRRDTTLQRLLKKYPELPSECEACGETRVLDVAHRPDHSRNGAWRTLANSTPDKIWVLCPLCHALLDRLGYTAKQLGIRDRKAVHQRALFVAYRRPEPATRVANCPK
jgi:hypothetical protein